MLSFDDVELEDNGNYALRVRNTYEGMANYLISIGFEVEDGSAHGEKDFVHHAYDTNGKCSIRLFEVPTYANYASGAGAEVSYFDKRVWFFWDATGGTCRHVGSSYLSLLDCLKSTPHDRLLEYP